MKGLCSAFAFVCLVIMVIGMLLIYNRDHHEIAHWDSPDGSTQVQLQFDFEEPEGREVGVRTVRVKRKGGQAVEAMRIEGYSQGQTNDIVWSKDGRYFMWVSDMIVGQDEVPPRLKLGGLTIFLLYDLQENKGWQGPNHGAQPALNDEHLAVDWGDFVNKRLERPQTPAVEPSPTVGETPSPAIFATPTP